MHRAIFVVGFLTVAPALVMAEDIGDTPDGAKRTSFNGRIKETLSSPTDVDFIRFDVRPDRDNPERDTSGNITVNFSQQSPPGTNSQSGWQIELYSENNLAQSLYTATLPETSLETEFEQGLSPGVYYYKISSIDNVVFPAAEYTLKGTWEESSNYEKPANDKPETATAITVNKAYWGNLSSVSDVDVYRFALPNPDSVTITLSQDVPGADPTIGWQFGLLSQYQAAIDVPSVQLSGVFPAALDVGTHYIFVMAMPPQAGQPARAPVGRRYQIKVDAASVAPPPSQTECSFVFTYAQNPQTNRWASFPTPCDVPAGWFSQQTPPETFEVCPSPHATYTPPLVKTDGAAQAGLLVIPTLELLTAEKEVQSLWRITMQQVPTASEDQYQFQVLFDSSRFIRVVQETPVEESPAEVPPVAPEATN